MSKCVICGKEGAKDIIGENGKLEKRCDECNWEIIKREQNQYAEKYKRALRWLKENDYVNIVKTFNENGEEDIRIFEIESDHNSAVDIIRQEMAATDFEESWIDIHWEVFDGVGVEVCDYLCFEKYKATITDSDYFDGDVSESKSFNFEVIKRNDI